MPHVEGLHPELKKWAYRLYARARRRKRLAPPQQCEVCGAAAPLVAHHRDYGMPITQLVWACRRCHLLIHRGLAH